MLGNMLNNRLRNEFGERLIRSRARDLSRVFAIILLTATAIGLIAAAIPLWALSDKPSPAKVTEDLPAGAMQAKATTACLECHEARIILQQRLSKGAWTKEVDKMMKWGAVVDPSDHDALVDYLSVNFSPDESAYEPPRTAVEKSRPQKSAGKSAK
jgi:hypothetical protein